MCNGIESDNKNTKIQLNIFMEINRVLMNLKQQLVKIEKRNSLLRKNVIKLNLYNMRKIKLKLESFKYIIPIIFKVIKFKIKLWIHKNF